MVRNYSAQGLTVDKCLDIVRLSKNQYYHKSTGQPKGRRPSTTTLRKDRTTQQVYEVDNKDVVDRIVSIKLDPDHANYYRLITKTLCLDGFYINHKKVYRLMYEYILLEPKSRTGKKKYVQHRRVAPKGPLEVLEMDIKYFWVQGKRRYAYVLTVIDTFSRYVLHWDVGYSMKGSQVKALWEYIIANYLQKHKSGLNSLDIEVRSDNGSQFSSNEVVMFFEQNELTRVFTHPYTPEENGHVESFHKTIGKSLSKDSFMELSDLENRLSTFYLAYNNKRAHGSTLGLPPSIFWALYDEDAIEVLRNEEKRSLKFKLKVAYQDILDLTHIDRYQYRVDRAS